MPLDEDFVSNLRPEKLSRLVDTSGFDCGKPDLNDFLKKDAIEHQELSIAVTYIFIHVDKNTIIGYYSVCCDAIRLSKEEKSSVGPQYPDYPAIKIARLAVDKNYQRKGVGTLLLKDALGLAREVSKDTACRFVTVDALPEEDSVGLYNRFGFVRNLVEQERSRRTISMRYDIKASTSP